MSASRYRRWGLIPLPARILAAAAVGAITLLAGGPALGRASAAPLGSCSRSHGTIVAVDFAHWGGPIVRGCGVGKHSGYALLHAAGFTTAGDEHDGPAVVCRLGDAAFHHGTQYPTPNQTGCVQTPPTTGYWAYWVAPRGTNHWAYGPLGAMGDVPRPGEVELWIFGATNVAGTHGTAVPMFSPSTLSEPARSHPRTRRQPPPRTTPATTTNAHIDDHDHHDTHVRRRAPRSRRPRRPRAPAARHRRTPVHIRRAITIRAPRRRIMRRRRGGAQTTATFSLSTTRAGGTKVVSARPTSRRASAGSSTPLIIGVALVLLLSAGAGRAIWLRRREE